MSRPSYLGGQFFLLETFQCSIKTGFSGFKACFAKLVGASICAITSSKPVRQRRWSNNCSSGKQNVPSGPEERVLGIVVTKRQILPCAQGNPGCSGPTTWGKLWPKVCATHPLSLVWGYPVKTWVVRPVTERLHGPIGNKPFYLRDRWPLFHCTQSSGSGAKATAS